MYPISLHLAERPVLIVGGGAVAERRALGALTAHAAVTVVAPQISEALAALAAAERIILHERAFLSSDVDGMMLVFAATNDADVNNAVVAAARAARILCNDAQMSELGDFAVPAIHRVGALTFTVETQGSSPSFAKRMRAELEAHFGDVYGRAAEALAQMREIVKATIPLERRSAIMEQLATRSVEELASMHLGDLENAVEAASEADLAARGNLASFTPQSRICATRASALALTQTRMVTARLALEGVASTLLSVTSTGDRVTDRPLTEIGTGVFVAELEHALREKSADYAVHSCKDLPSRLPDDLCIAAITKRADARDMFCSHEYASFAALPAGARIGTSSPRRRAQLAALRPDVVCVELRGNIDTRLRHLAEGRYDAVVLAAAGLERLDIRARFMQAFSIEEMIPAVGQGALAIETRIDDPAWIATLNNALTDTTTELAVIAERAFLAEVRGGCHSPVGAHGIVDDQRRLHFRAIIVSLDGKTRAGEERTAVLSHDDAAARSQAERLGRSAARNLLERGGQAILDASRPDELAPLHGKRVLIGRTQDRPSRIATALRSVGALVIEIGEDDIIDLEDEIIDAILFPSSGSVAVVAARTSALFHAAAGTVVIAMGPASAQAASEAGFTPHAVSPKPDVGSFVHVVTTTLLEHVR